MDSDSLRLNSLAGAPAAKPRRVGRGPGSGHGKTAGRGHKGQKSRAGGGVRPGFEGGQMPLQRRIPKRGFVSRKALFSVELRLGDLAKIPAPADGAKSAAAIVDLAALRRAGLTPHYCRFVKIIGGGKGDKPPTRAFRLRGVGATRAARAAIESAGGAVEAAVKRPKRFAKKSERSGVTGQQSSAVEA